MEFVLAFIHECLSWSEWLDVKSDFFLGLIIFHQDHTTENYQSICWSLFVKLQLFSRGGDGGLYGTHGGLGLDVSSLSVLRVQECDGIVYRFLWWDNKGYHRCTISDKKKHGVSQYTKHLFTNQFNRFFLIDPKSHLPFALFKSFHDSLDFPHFNVLVFDVGVKLLTVHILICF